MKSSKIILLPLDGSNSSLKGILPAKSLAILLNTHVHIIHISEETLSHQDLLKKLGISTKEISEFVITHKRGNPIEIILEEAKSASCIIICNNKTEFINPVTLKVLEKSNVPVLLFKPDTIITPNDGAWIPGRILIPLDGTPDSAQAFDASFDIIREAKADIDVVHILNLDNEGEEDSIKAPYYVDHSYQEWSLWSEEFLKRFFPYNPTDTHVKLHVSTHNPAEEILSFAKKNKNDLVVLAWNGKLSSGHGEVLKKIIREISCPILLNKIIPGKQYLHRTSATGDN